MATNPEAAEDNFVTTSLAVNASCFEDDPCARAVVADLLAHFCPPVWIFGLHGDAGEDPDAFAESDPRWLTFVDVWFADRGQDDQVIAQELRPGRAN